MHRLTGGMPLFHPHFHLHCNKIVTDILSWCDDSRGFCLHDDIRKSHAGYWRIWRYGQFLLFKERIEDTGGKSNFRCSGFWCLAARDWAVFQRVCRRGWLPAAFPYSRILRWLVKSMASGLYPTRCCLIVMLSSMMKPMMVVKQQPPHDNV